MPCIPLSALGVVMDHRNWKENLLIVVCVVILTGWLAVLAYGLAHQVPENFR
jgi:hypothetical protein